MSMRDLPIAVTKVIEGSIVSEFATVSGAGVPIDTPTYCFPSNDLVSIGVATGLSYPAKAERARRNPKVGLLLEGLPGEPVVLIRGIAAVRDADLQANAIRYISETGYEAVAAAAKLSWEDARKALWYWTRIIVDIAPERVMWWDEAAAMDKAPHILTVPPLAGFRSDPAPPGRGSAPSQWPQKSWQEIADIAAERGAPGHLTLLDGAGWPLPVRARTCERIEGGFRLDLPAGAPWPQRSGKATLTFQGVETFVGNAIDEDGAIRLVVERALPQHPLILDPAQVLSPNEDVRTQLLARLTEETARRGQPLPVLPDEPPARTRLAQARFERATAFTELS